MYFWSYGLRKTWLDKCVKSSLSEDPSTTNIVKGSKHCSMLKDSTFSILLSMWGQFMSKKLSWVIWNILGLSVNPLTASDKYFLLKNGNLLQHFQMQLSQNWKIFSQFFLNFINLDSIFNISEKKMTLIADVFLNLWTPENVVR